MLQFIDNDYLNHNENLKKSRFSTLASRFLISIWLLDSARSDISFLNSRFSSLNIASLQIAIGAARQDKNYFTNSSIGFPVQPLGNSICNIAANVAAISTTLKGFAVLPFGIFHPYHIKGTCVS